MLNFLMKGGAVKIFEKGICGIGDGFCAAFHQTVQTLMGTLYKVLGLFADLMHIAFYILAGVDMKAGGNEHGMFDIELISTGSRQNILDYFVFNESVTKAYWILAGIGLLLIVVFTVYKIVKQDYFDRAGPRSKGPIFRNVAISAISFLLVIPIFYVIIHVSSLLAVAVMDAMGMNATTFAGAQIFQLSWNDNGEAMRYVNSMLMNNGLETPVYSSESFKWMLELDTDTIFILMAPEPNYVNYAPGLLSALKVESYDGGLITNTGYNCGNAQFYWYIYLVGVIVGIKALYKLLQAMLQRIFKILGLFIVAPSPISQYVLDDGTKFQSWLKQSIQEGLRLVVATMSFSIFLMVLKLVSDINFITPFKDAADAATQAESINVSANLLAYNEEFANIPMLAAPGTDSEAGALENAFYSLANAFMQVFMIMGAGGAISDLDPLLSGLISGAGSSLEAGKTGEGANAAAKAATGLATRAAGAAVGGALSVAKGAASLAVGGIAGAVKAGVNASEKRLEDATKEDNGGSDDDTKEETSTATVENGVNNSTNAEGNNGENEGVNSPEATETGEQEAEETTEKAEGNDETSETTENPSGKDNETGDTDEVGAENTGNNEQANATGSENTANNGAGAQSGNGQANAGNKSAGKQESAKSPNGSKPAAQKGDPNVVAKRQARLKRRTGAKAVGNVLKGIFTGKVETVKDKDGNVVKDKNGKPVKKVKIPGIKQVFGAAGGFLKALNLKQALVDSGLVSKDMVENFDTARATNQEALDTNLVNPAVEAGKAGLAKAGGAIGGAWEQARMSKDIEKTDTAQRHHAAMQNVEDKTQELAEANEKYSTAKGKENLYQQHYEALKQEQAEAEEKDRNATADAQVAYAANNKNATVEQKEKLNKYINGEISDEEAGADLKAFKAAGADKARTARTAAKHAADVAENGEYGYDEDGYRGLVRAGRQQYETSVAETEQAAKDADSKLDSLNKAIGYANSTSVDYNNLYRTTKTRGNYTTQDKSTGRKTVGVGDVTRGKLGKANAKLEAANAMDKSKKAPNATKVTHETIDQKIDRLTKANEADDELVKQYGEQIKEFEDSAKKVETEHKETIVTMGGSVDGNTVSGVSSKVQTKLETLRDKKITKINAEKAGVESQREAVEQRKNDRTREIERLTRKRGLSSPTAVMDTLNSQIGSLDAQMMEMKNNPYYQSDEVAYNDAKRDYQSNPTPENKARYEAQKGVHDARVKEYDDMKRRKDALVATKKSMENIESEPEQNERKIQVLDGKIADKRAEEAELNKKDAKLAKKQEQISAAANPVNDKYDKLDKMRKVLDAIERGENVPAEQLEEFNSLGLPGGAKKIGGALQTVKGHVEKRSAIEAELEEIHTPGKGPSKGKGLKLTRDLDKVNEELGGGVKVLRTALDKEMASTSGEIKSYTTQMYETEKERRAVEGQKTAVQTTIKGYENEQAQLRANTGTVEARLQQAASIGASVAGYNYNPQAESQSTKSQTPQAQTNANDKGVKEVKTVEKEKETSTATVTSSASTRSETTTTSGVKERNTDDKGVKIDRGEWSEGAKVMADEISDAVASAAKKVLSGEKGAGRDTGLGAASEVNNISQNVTINDPSKTNELKGPDSDNKYAEEDHVTIRNIKQKVDEMNEEIHDENNN